MFLNFLGNYVMWTRKIGKIIEFDQGFVPKNMFDLFFVKIFWLRYENITNFVAMYIQFHRFVSGLIFAA